MFYDTGSTNKLYVGIATATSAVAEKVRLAVTSSFHNSGLSDHIIPHIETDLEIDIQLIVVGTGQALKLGENGDVDAILVHSKPDEKEFVKKGFANHRREIMFNEYVIWVRHLIPHNIICKKFIRSL